MSAKPKGTGRKSSIFTERIILMGIPAGIIITIAILFHFSAVSQQKASIRRTVEHWAAKYELTDEQIKSIQAVEIRYHGSGSPFSITSFREEDDKDAHYRELSGHFPSKTVDAFLQDVATAKPH